MHSNHFTREEAERAFYKILHHGDEKPIADHCDAGYSITAQYFDPNSERESDLFRAACKLAAWIEVNPIDGEQALMTFVSLVRRALPADSHLSVEKTRRHDMKEGMEFELAQMDGTSLDAQIIEGEQAIAARQRHVAALKAELARQRQRAAFPGQRVSHGTRAEISRQMMNGRGK